MQNEKGTKTPKEIKGESKKKKLKERVNEEIFFFCLNQHKIRISSSKWMKVCEMGENATISINEIAH